MEYVASFVPSIQDQNKQVEMYQTLVSEYNKNGSLSNKDFLVSLRLARSAGFEEGMNSVTDINNRIPKNWARPKCSLCGKALHGVVFDTADKKADLITNTLKSWNHVACSDKRKSGTASATGKS